MPLKPFILPCGLKLLEAMGYSFGMDWDGELLIEPPQEIDPEAFKEWLLEHYDEAIARLLECRADNERSQCVGGPFNGRKHGYCSGKAFAIDIRRGEWAAYLVMPDSRAKFCGLAGSEAKAKKLAESSKTPSTN